ncbi:F-box protein SKIP23-like [Cucumis melo var. makuwa]|uniref:F-box protein SKIP23-like n=1 Tax=Cucumis melo var. makuwa TaxID=1194695 RepID=A0A5D3D7D4_CUCMM|nr:F-box protein SKIP23-like [Cucumis melo var. makuwa]
MDCSESRDWTTLEYDILGVILNKMMSLYDYLQFSLVCKSWNFVALRHRHQRSVITSEFPQLPMLIVPSKDDIEKQHCLYDVTNNKIRTADFKFCFNKRCCGSSFGWLIMHEETFDVTLFNPFSGTVIRLPPLPKEHEDDDYYPWYILKAILTKDPSLYPNDYMVVAIYGISTKLCLIEAKSKIWKKYDIPPGQDYNPFEDVYVCNDTLYASHLDDVQLNLWEVEVDENSPISLQRIAVTLQPSLSRHDFGPMFIVESSKKELLLIRRILSVEDHEQPDSDITTTLVKTIKFVAYKHTHTCNDGTQRFEEVKSLDDDAVFIGEQSICISTKNFPKCLPNCIYYIDNRYYSHDPFVNGPQDIGIYNLEDGSFGEHYIPNIAH